MKRLVPKALKNVLRQLKESISENRFESDRIKYFRGAWFLVLNEISDWLVYQISFAEQ